MNKEVAQSSETCVCLPLRQTTRRNTTEKSNVNTHLPDNPKFIMPQMNMFLKNAVFWDVALCRSCVNRRFGETYHLHLQGRKIRELSVFDRSVSPQPPAHAGSSLADFSTLKMQVIRSSETSVHTRTTQCHIPEDGILHSHRSESLKSYNTFLLIT
jgi:hypothetical protein